LAVNSIFREEAEHNFRKNAIMYCRGILQLIQKIFKSWTSASSITE
jgi:hypothetical protein